MRTYHPYTTWEEYHHGMWRRRSREEEERLLAEAVAFTGDHLLYGSWMLKVVESWPISCEQHLADMGLNRQAWVGHAACCFAIGAPEHITRQAWWMLTEEQRTLANKQADIAIEAWERVRREQCQGNQLELMY